MLQIKSKLCLHYTLTIFIVPDIDASRCGAGWYEYETECYKISDTKASWGVSKEYCEGFNAKMVVPTTPKQQFFLYGKTSYSGQQKTDFHILKLARMSNMRPLLNCKIKILKYNRK